MQTFVLKLKQPSFTYLRYSLESLGPLKVDPASPDILGFLKDSEAVTLIVSEKAVDQFPLPANLQSGFRVLEIEGPLEFSLVGILKSLTTILADRNIPLCALSTYDTDMLLVARKYLPTAIEAIEAAGHTVKR